MSVVEIIRLPVAAADAQALAATVLAGRDSYLAPPRCQEVQVLQAVAGDEVVVLATWASQAAHDEAAAEPTTGAFLDGVGRLAAGPPSVAFYTAAFDTAAFDTAQPDATGGGA
ncbi:antibiotic biosynthesis monooxygenase [Blastococcus sp. SYSU D00820]